MVYNASKSLAKVKHINIRPKLTKPEVCGTTLTTHEQLTTDETRLLQLPIQSKAKPEKEKQTTLAPVLL